MKVTRITGAVAAVAAGALVLTGCGSSYESDVVAGTEITVAYNSGFFHFNDDSSAGNNTANGNVKYITDTTFAYYNSEPALVRNELFGSYEKTSDDPLTVSFQINAEAKPVWSDSVPIDEADLLLGWATGAIDEEGNALYPQFAPAGLGQVATTYALSEGGITVTYAKPYPDWELTGMGGTGVSAHGTYALAFPDEYADVQAAYDAALTSGEFDDYYKASVEFATDAKAKVIAAIEGNDTAVLEPLANAWNTAYGYTTLPASPAAALTSGPYVIDEIVEDSHITLTANPLYTGWGPNPKFEKITIRTISDSTAALQALQTGEIDIWTGQPTADSLEIAQSIEGAGIEQRTQASYEHIDLTFNNGGPFDPAFWGGDEEKALQARIAFLKAVPRDEIVEKLIKPLDEAAEPRNSYRLIPGSEDYDYVVENNGFLEAFGNLDIDGALALVEGLGYSVENPIDVKFWWPTGNVRRASEFEIIAQSVALAGFNLIANDEPDWLFTEPTEEPINPHDATIFAWSSTSLAVSGDDQLFGCYDDPLNKLGNYSGYCNPEVDALLAELNSEPDTAAQTELILQVEQKLVEDAYGTLIFQFPGLTVWNAEKVTGVVDNPLSPNYFWNFWDWTPVVAATPAS